MSLEVKRPKLYTIEEARTDYLQEKIGRNRIYDAVKSGELAHISLGRKVLLTEDALSAWLASMTRQAV